MVVIVLVSNGNVCVLLWSCHKWSSVPESIDNEREERVCVSVSGCFNNSEVYTHVFMSASEALMWFGATWGGCYICHGLHVHIHLCIHEVFVSVCV